jgi:hypothetical protein
MIFLIRVFTYLNCKDCAKHLKTLREYCSRSPANLEITDVDDEKNLHLIFEHKIEFIPYTICYDIRGNILHKISGVKTIEEFEDIVYYGIQDESE